MNRTLALKAIADETRMSILTLLLQHNYCVRALSRKLGITEAAISQHLKVLREAGLLVGEKKGYFMHYDVDRTALHGLAREIETLAAIEREDCTPRQGGCRSTDSGKCHIAKAGAHMNEGHMCCHESREADDCSDTSNDLYHRHNHMKECEEHEHCRCHKS